MQPLTGDPLWKARLAEDRQREYQAYIHSPGWYERRDACLKRAKGKCEVCRIRKARHAHHLTYARFRNEPPEDLQAICRKCHYEIHAPYPWMARKRARAQGKSRKSANRRNLPAIWDPAWCALAQRRLAESPGDIRASLIASYAHG